MMASIWQFVVFAGLAVFLIWLPVRIMHKAGYSGWWVLLVLVPALNFVMLWVFAFRTWPRGDHRRASEAGMERKRQQDQSPPA